MPQYLEPIGVPQWSEGEKPKREQFNEAFRALNGCYAGIDTDALRRAETAAQNAAKSVEDAQKIKDSTELQYRVDGDRVGFKRPNEADYTYTTHLTGPTGEPLRIAGHYGNLDELQAAYPAGDGENAYVVGKRVYVWAGGAWRETDISGAIGAVNGQTADDTGNITVTAANIPTASGQTVQRELDGLHTDVWDTLNIHPTTPHAYTATRPCILRPSFCGRTVQEGTPSPENPAPIKGALNPWARAYTGEAVQVTAEVAPMMRLPDGTADRIAYRDGQWGIERWNTKFTLMGTETPFDVGIGESFPGLVVVQYRLPHLALTISPTACNYFEFIYGWDYVGVSFYVINELAVLKIPRSLLSSFDAAGVQAWVATLYNAGNPLTLWYQAATPTFEPIPAWNNFGKIDPITVTTTITKPNPDAPISPDNVATITGTPVVTTGYRGMVRQLIAEVFEGGEFDGTNLSNAQMRYECTGDEPYESWQELVSVNYLPRPGLNPVGAYFTHGWAAVMGEYTAHLHLNNEAAADWPNYAKAQIAARQPVTIVYGLVTPVITRHNLALPLTPGAWTIEAGDDNGLLEHMDVEVLPDPATYGNRVYPYQHSKAGTVHRLTGTPGAAEISFEATAPYLDGDTWTINGAPVAVTYADGQTLLPTAVIAGDSIRAMLEGDALRLMLDKPTPQKGIEDNGRFDVWQRGTVLNTTTGSYAADRWQYISAAKSNSFALVNEAAPGFQHSLKWPVAGESVLTAILRQFFEKPFYGPAVCACMVKGPKGATASFTISDIAWYLHTFTGEWDFVVYTLDNPGAIGFFDVIRNPSMAGDYYICAVKLEPGPRFTGWYEPKPGETLAECQRYQYSVVSNDGGGIRDISTSGIAYDAALAVFSIPIPVMRAIPTLIVSDISKLRLHGMFSGVYRNDIIPKAIWVHNASKSDCTLRVDVDPSTPYTVGNVYGLYSIDGSVSVILDTNIY